MNCTFVFVSLQITHPAGCFSQFLQFFGPQVFSLWRLALLKKRILLFSPPPAGIACYRVYCTSVLASHNLDNLELDTELNPMFFVNVADIDKISEESSFIACEWLIDSTIGANLSIIMNINRVLNNCYIA